MLLCLFFFPICVYGQYHFGVQLLFNGGFLSLTPEEKFITDGTIVEAKEANEEDLLVVHSKRYLNRLKVVFSSFDVIFLVNILH